MVRVRAEVMVRVRVEDRVRHTSQSFLSAASALVVLRNARFRSAAWLGLGCDQGLGRSREYSIVGVRARVIALAFGRLLFQRPVLVADDQVRLVTARATARARARARARD